MHAAVYLLLGLLPAIALFGWALRQRRAMLAAQRLEQARMRDALTGLGSRHAFEQQLRALAARVQADAALVVLVVDVYRFGQVNERWGRSVGDAVLALLAQRMRTLPDAAALARVGPDSFAAAFVNVDVERSNALIDAAVDLMREPFDVKPDCAPALSASVGCALYPTDSVNPSRLLGAAEAAVFGQVERRRQSHAAELDPYGSEAALRLAWAARFVKGKLRNFEREFLARLQGLEAEPPLRVLLNELGLGCRPGEGHVELLLRPGLDAARHRERANALGRLLAATGVSPRAGIRATSWLLQAFSALNQRIPGRLSQRQLLLEVVSRRLEADIALRAEGAEALRLEVDTALRELAGALPALQRRVELLDAAVNALGQLPFVSFCAAHVSTADAGFELEAESHAHRLWREARARQPLGASATAGSNAADGDAADDEAAASAMTRAWTSAQLELADAAELAMLQRSGIRAHAALSVPDVAGRPPLVLTLYGKIPGQFATATMRGYLDSARLALGRELRRIHDGAAAPAVAADRRALWRQRLFGGGLRMHMQPIVHLASAACTKVEALARLQLDDGTLLPPAQFLPILGHLELDRLFVDGLHQALAALHHWEMQGTLLELSYNLPPSTLRNPDCVAWISSALQRHRLAPSRLTLELLEHEAYADEDELKRNAAKLHMLGVRLALDDLGSGYSSLLRLRNLPFDLVKIDQSLVRGIAHDNRRSVPLVAGLVELARRLGVEVAIEGLETQILLEFAADLRADYAQGYAIARPMPASRIPGWTQAWRMPPLSGVNPFAPQETTI